MDKSFIERLHPDILEMYEAMPEYSADFPGSVREMMVDFLASEAPADEEILVSERSVLNGKTNEEVGIRIYSSVSDDSVKPGLLWIHGGGYVGGMAIIDDALCIRVAKEASCVVVSVDYHLAPEYPYPVPLEDCYAALQWFADNSGELHVDENRIAVAGNSAGGGLTAALALLARDRGGPKLCFQMPLYPMIDDRNSTPSSYEIHDPKVWTYEKNAVAWSQYLGKEKPDQVPVYAAPARATDLAGLPPLYTCIGELDVFRDETLDYVTRLARAGVPAEFHLYPGCFHGFDLDLPGIKCDIGERARNDYIRALVMALASA